MPDKVWHVIKCNRKEINNGLHSKREMCEQIKNVEIVYKITQTLFLNHMHVFTNIYVDL